MNVPAISYSDDQATAHDSVAEMLRAAGINLEDSLLMPPRDNTDQVMAVTGKAGSGKTLLLAERYKALEGAGVEVVSGDYESKKRKDKRTLAILAPTNKAASVLRLRGVPATTIHRILYTPVYDPEYERIAEWLASNGERPEIDGLTEIALDRAHAFFQNNESIPGALAAAGLRGSDFITGWKRREEPLDIGFVDEASMLDDKQIEDLKEIFPTLLLFGDPAQLAPVNQSGTMVFEKLPEKRVLNLSRIHRQEADNPILDLAHALADPELGFEQFERMIEEAAALGIGHKVLFTGFLRGKDVDRVFQMADCYVMPSVSEPFGIAPREAMKNDVPVIISKQSGVSEVLTHALKVDFWDTDEMANKIIAVLRHPPLSQTLRQHGPMELRGLTWDGAARRVIDLYRDVLESVGQPM